MQLISNGQVKRIQVLRRAVFPSDVEYRAALSAFGVDSCKKLNVIQAGELITTMQQHARKQPLRVVYGTGKKGASNRHLTQAQAERIELLAVLGKRSQAAIFGFIKHTCQRGKPVQMLTKAEASSVIVGLQRLLFEDASIEVNKCSNAVLREMVRMMKVEVKDASAS